MNDNHSYVTKLSQVSAILLSAWSASIGFSPYSNISGIKIGRGSINIFRMLLFSQFPQARPPILPKNFHSEAVLSILLIAHRWISCTTILLWKKMDHCSMIFHDSFRQYFGWVFVMSLWLQKSSRFLHMPIKETSILRALSQEIMHLNLTCSIGIH